MYLKVRIFKKPKVSAKQTTKDKELTFRGYLDEFYLEWHKKSRKEHNSVRGMLLNRCKAFHEVKLADIDKPMVNKLLYKYVSEHGVGNASFNRTLAAIKGAISRAVEFGYLDENKLAGFKQLTESTNKVRYLSETEKNRLFICNSLDLI